MKYVPPSIKETAFNCPHCGALAKQFWNRFGISPLKDDGKPTTHEDFVDVDRKLFQDDEGFEEFCEYLERLKSGRPFIDGTDDTYKPARLCNVHMSRCYNCKDVALWIGERLIYPLKGEAPPSNPDLPPDIAADYQEASSILDLSPRGASALVRLCIQKLCIHLGQPGKNINADIGALVAAGLDARVQRALDAVRVIGNNAVHPGSMDLNDDRATAESLFRLLNLIAEKMISEPKHVDEVYASLPSGALEAIEKRDKVDGK